MSDAERVRRALQEVRSFTREHRGGKSDDASGTSTDEAAKALARIRQAAESSGGGKSNGQQSVAKLLERLRDR